MLNLGNPFIYSSPFGMGIYPMQQGQEMSPMSMLGGPWGIGLTAASAAAPVAGGILSRQSPPPGPAPGGGGLGMTKGLDPNWLGLYGRQLRPQFRSMLGQYLR